MSVSTTSVNGGKVIDPTLFLPAARTLLKTDKSMTKTVQGFVRHVLVPTNHENTAQLLQSTSEKGIGTNHPEYDFSTGDDSSLTSHLYQASTYSWLKANYSTASKNQEDNTAVTKNQYDNEMNLEYEQNFQNQYQHNENYEKLKREESFRSTQSSVFTDTLTHPTTSQSQRPKDVYNTLPLVSTGSLETQNDRDRFLSPGRRLESRLLAAEVTRLGGIPSSPAQVDIHGFLISRSAMHEGVVSFVKKQDQEQRKTQSAGGRIGEQAFDESVAGSQSTNNKTNLNPTNIYPALYYKEKNLPEPASISLIHSNTENSSEKFLKMTARSKISSIVTMGEDDYASKWMRMKAKRDHEFHSEMKNEKRTQLRHLLQRIAINSDK